MFGPGTVRGRVYPLPTSISIIIILLASQNFIWNDQALFFHIAFVLCKRLKILKLNWPSKTPPLHVLHVCVCISSVELCKCLFPSRFESVLYADAFSSVLSIRMKRLLQLKNYMWRTCMPPQLITYASVKFKNTYRQKERI